ncbi:MAG: GNAT family protein [Bacillota bacterium]|nr:GNAT family protein [Bacillota bacterium]
MYFPILETKRLQLVELKKKHAADLFAILSNDDVIVHYGMEKMNHMSEALRLIEILHSTYLENRGIRWGIIRKRDGQLIGTAGLNAFNGKHKRAEIGYEIHPAFWRQGYASEAVSELLAYSFGSMGLSRIGAIVYPANFASSSLLTKLGFQHEGLLRDYMYQNNESHDTNVYSLLKEEWKNKWRKRPV